MKADDTDKLKEGNNTQKPEEKPINLTEERLLKLLERERHFTASECFKFFEKFQKEEKEAQRENARAERWWKYGSTLFGILVAVGGFYLLWFSGLETETATSKRLYNQHQVALIQADIAEKKKLLEEGSYAIGDLRKVSYKILLHCEYNHPYTQEEQDEMRWMARQKIADTFSLGVYVFNQEFSKREADLISFDANIKDICTYKGDYDETIRQYKIKLYDVANKLLEEDLQKILKFK
jgi:hypothetical protein